MSASSSPGSADPPIGTPLVMGGETVYFAGRTDSGVPIFSQSQPIPSDEPENAEYRFDAGTAPEVKLRAIERGTARQAAHARRMAAGRVRESTLASVRRGRLQAREIKAREIDTIGSSCLTRHSRAREQRPQRRPGSSSTTSSADPGDPEEPDTPAARICGAAWCSHPVYGPPSKIFCGTERCDRARAAERQRQRRDGNLTDADRVQLEEARIAHYVGGDAFGLPLEHSQSFLWKFGILDGDDPGERDALLHRTCRCNGHHIDAGVVGCFRCGLSRQLVAA